MDATGARRCVLAVGAMDPVAETGVLADARAVADAGCTPLAVVTAVLTGASGLDAAVPVTSQVVGDQFKALKGRSVDAVKVGAISDHASIDLIAAEVRKLRAPLVLDPELDAMKLNISRTWLRAYREALVAAATVLVVDAAEGQQLAGSPATAADLVRALLALGPGWVVLKRRAADGDEHEDVVSDGKSWFGVRSRAVATKARAGDWFSAGLAAHVAAGKTVPEAASAAREQVVAFLGTVPPVVG